MQDKNYIAEDEIDLRELFKVVADKKKFIFVLTGIITVLALIYVFIKTPIYEVKSVVRIGYIETVLLENSNILEKKLRLIFNVDNKKAITKDNAIVSDISAVKKVDNFIEISVLAFSNDEALKKNKEVLSFLQNEYKYKIDEYVLKTQLNIKDLETKITYINSVNKVEIEEQIKFLNSIDLISIENKLKFNKEKLKEYQENIKKISEKISINDTQNILAAMQILNNQNLILNLQNQIENLNKEKQDILNEKIPKLKRQLEYTIPNALNDMKDKMELEKLKLTKNIVKNSELVGEIQLNDSPIKPKKALIVTVAFVTGFILSIFIVFFMQFVSSFRKEDVK